jgi:hypothetical protein
VTSKGKWDVMRRGKQFMFRGKIDHELKDPFDFDEGQPGHSEAEVLEHSGDARPFTVRHRFSEPSSALTELRPDGGLRLISRSLGKPVTSFLGR